MDRGRWARSGARRRLGGAELGAAVVGPRPDATPQSRIVAAEFAAVGAPGTGHDRANLFACTLHDLGHRRAEAPADPAVAARRDQVVSALQRTRRRARTWPACAPAPTGTATDCVVNGQKVWTSFATTADYGLLVARTDWDVPKHNGHQLLHVPDAPARRRGPARSTRSPASPSSTRCSSPTRWCPPRTWSVTRGGGWWVLQTALAYERRLMGDLARTRGGAASRRPTPTA